MTKRTCILAALTAFTVIIGGCGSQGNDTAARLETYSGSLQMEASSPAVQTNEAASSHTGTDSVKSSAVSSTDNTKENLLTDEKAKEIALSDAGVSESDIISYRIKEETKNGKIVYDVEFYVNDREYDYEIDASDGTILSKDTDIEDDFRGSSSGTDKVSANMISQEKALEIVLERVPGATAENVKLKLDQDDGHHIYEGEIRYNGMEYEFELNAQTGDVLEWSQEHKD